jgi:membrane dipeptidase
MNDSSKDTKQLHRRSTVIDTHVHPSLKTYILNMKMNRRYKTEGCWNPFTLRVDLQKIIEGCVNAIFSAAYLPEKLMIEDCWALKLMSLFVGTRVRRMVKDNPFDTTMRIIDHFEKVVEKARIKGKQVAQIARSRTELKQILNSGRIAVLHTIEGGHSLDGKIGNLKKFFDRGVCLLTLAHFYENALVPTVGGIPENKKFLCCFKNEGSQEGSLTEFGREVVHEMIRMGMLIDITHCNPDTREEVLDMNDHARPILCTHVGIRKLNPHPYNLSDREIGRIAETGGVIGTIHMNYWLIGRERPKGLEYVMQTMKHLRNKGGIDCVALGSDLDGLTDPPDDIKDISEFPKLTHALKQAGFSDDDIEKILGKNVLRVLDQGWGRP